MVQRFRPFCWSMCLTVISHPLFQLLGVRHRLPDEAVGMQLNYLTLTARYFDLGQYDPMSERGSEAMPSTATDLEPSPGAERRQVTAGWFIDWRFGVECLSGFI